MDIIPPSKTENFIKLALSLAVVAWTFYEGMEYAPSIDFAYPRFSHITDSRWFDGFYYGYPTWLLYVTPFVATVLAFQSRRLTAIFSLTSATFVLSCLATSPIEGASSRWVGLVLFSIVAPGMFWLVTWFIGWPQLIAIGTSIRKKATVVATAFFFCYGTIFVLSARSWLTYSPYGDVSCAACRVANRPKNQDHVMFTAHPIYEGTGRRDKYPYDWAILSVDHQYWGLPWWNKRLVLAHGKFIHGEKYLVEGIRTSGLLTWFIPIIHRDFCVNTIPTPLKDAQQELYDLDNPPPANTVRIRGDVRQRVYEPYSATNIGQGWPITIDGPVGPSTSNSDANGHFVLDSIPFGTYKIRSKDCPEGEKGTFEQCSYSHEVKSGETLNCALQGPQRTRTNTIH